MKLHRFVRKRHIAVILGLVLMLIWGDSNQVLAAETVDTDRNCTLTFEIPGAFCEALEEEIIDVRLYRIAKINADASYMALPGYETIKPEELSHSATAEQYEKKADAVAALLGVKTWQNVPAVMPDAELSVTNNQGSVGQLEAGLYLVCVKPIQKGTILYKAMPYIISLPNLLETKDLADNVIQSWNYDLAIDIKMSKVDLSTPKEAESPQKFEEPPTEKEPDTVTKYQNIAAYKTGDDLLLPIILGIVFLFGVAFFSVLFVEKKSVLRHFRNLLGTLFGLALIGLVIVFYQYRVMETRHEEVKQSVLLTTTDLSEEDDKNKANSVQKGEDTVSFLPQIDFEALREINEDAVGWLYACGGKIDYPIVASEDEYYLSHAIDGSKSKSGTIFVDAQSGEPFPMDVSVIYGHNMRDGSMFHELLEYWRKDKYLEQNPYIYIVTEDKVHTYAVENVYVAEYENIDFSADNNLCEQSVINLVTCEYSGKNTRLVVQAIECE